ncbi:MAG: helix-turn-helix domain-containing protein [Burkholderiales bacterium]|nr:helix-turn-helix domain-containing protein [Burkholderiales bacterium]
MSKKRALTAEELAAAAAIRRALGDPAITQEAVADLVGVTQGQVWQWAHGRMRVPAGRAVALAGALNLEPAIVSPAWRLATERSRISWPFPFDRARYDRLTPGQQLAIASVLLRELERIEAESKSAAVEADVSKPRSAQRRAG